MSIRDLRMCILHSLLLTTFFVMVWRLALGVACALSGDVSGGASDAALSDGGERVETS